MKRMFIERTYYFYQLTDYLTRQQGFELVFINNDQTEIWLQRKKNKKNHVIRIVNNGFDWKNQLRLDIERTIKNSKKLTNLFLGRNIEFHNVYVAEYAPVDDWKALKKTVNMNQRKFSRMHLYYLDDKEGAIEKNRLFESIDVEKFEITPPDNIMELESKTQYLKTSILGKYNQVKKQADQVFRYAKPTLTYWILAVNVLMFILLELQGGSTSTDILLQFGAKYNPAIIDGEWWRIISSMFLHIGLLHLVMNMLALHIVGSIVEQIYGSKRFLIIYFFAGIMGGLTSFALNPQLAAGASGAIFGLFGALLFFGFHHQRIFFQTMGWNVIVIIAFNIVFGFVVQQIDNGAHIGGLIGGLIASSIVFFPNKKQLSQQLLAIVAYIVIVVSLVLYGISNKSGHYDPMLQAQIANHLIEEEEFSQVIDVTSETLETEPTNFQAELLFLRSYAYSKLEQSSKALADLEVLVALEPNAIPEAYYNLTLIYMERGNTEKAKNAIREAVRLSPNNETFTSLAQELLGNE
ncbi:rhomboid protease GluP [Paraliobacillus quinghaiensis]|uniref:Rhomboid protease GluP n=1 Tax=Paraliobacillus quinghaiensis TaxID=470815 RepID=A0A917TPP0_9BACI|nr:rhomboid family intramembrane serine protease [Paraliobacillus quinghaiensis]GGM31553.1 rhomboid protease GluP [Paraliobacillus quinghaiensis]